MTSSIAPPRAPRARAATRPPVYPITSARRGVRDDVDSRTRRYLFSMGVRTACFLGAVVAGGWLRWLLLVMALLLPYLSVVLANGGRDRIEEPASLYDNDGPGSTGGTTLVQIEQRGASRIPFEWDSP
jgi:hypothetical protein